MVDIITSKNVTFDPLKQKYKKKHMLLVVKILQKNYVIILDHDDHRNYIK